MENLIEIGRAFVQSMLTRRGLQSVDELYDENAESVEAVVPLGRHTRVTSLEAAARAVSPARRFFPASRNSLDQL